MKKPGFDVARSTSYDPNARSDNNESNSVSRGGKSSASLASSRSLFGKGKGAIFGNNNISEQTKHALRSMRHHFSGD